ncbi:MAG: RNA polymerase sigma factor [Planctomycetota bacterium]|jgi:RNA polymerase sigma-70 factor (ECF subfamily)
MMSQDNEYIQQLLAESRSGSREGMGCLAVAVRERLYPFVLRTTLDHDTTEDILQETLLSVILQVTSLRETPRFWPWVYRIAWNKTQDSFRRQYVRASDKTSAAWNQPQEVQNESLLEIKAYEETLQQVSDGLDQLSRHHRDVLRLRYYEQLSYAQIASRTRTTPKVARARSYRAKKRLKTRLRACCV